MDYAMIIDYKFCTGCQTCEIACRKEKNIPLKEWGIKVQEVGPESLGGKMYWNYIPAPSSLCDMCIDRIDAGKKPSCELHCLAKVIEIVPVEQLQTKMLEKGKDVVCYL